MNTPMPLTDAFAAGYATTIPMELGGGAEIHHHTNEEWKHFARQLEQELSEARDARDRALQSYEATHAINVRLRADLNQLQFGKQP